MVLAAESRSCVAVDFESEEICCHSAEQVWGSQWPNAPISIVIHFLLFLNCSMHVGISPCSLSSILHYGGSHVSYTEQLVQFTSWLWLWAGQGVQDFSWDGILAGGLSVARISGRSAYNLFPCWRPFPRPWALRYCHTARVYLPCDRDTGHPFSMYWTVGHKIP